MGPVFGMRYDIGAHHNRATGFRVPKSAAAQGDSRRRSSFLVVATEGALVAPQALLLGERRPPIRTC